MLAPFLELLRIKSQYWFRKTFSPKERGENVQSYEIINCPVEILLDRFSIPFTEHPHLRIFSIPFKEAAELYEEYTKYIRTHQQGEWIKELGIHPGRLIPFWITPWGGAEKKYEGYRLTKKYAKKYIQSLLDTKRSLEINGYVPENFPPITGQLLIDDNNQERVIIWNGNRRTLSLIKLGYKSIPVEISGGNRWKGLHQQTTIKISELREWENVKNNTYSPEQASKFFKIFFSRETTRK